MEKVGVTEVMRGETVFFCCKLGSGGEVEGLNRYL